MWELTHKTELSTLGICLTTVYTTQSGGAGGTVSGGQAHQPSQMLSNAAGVRCSCVWHLAKANDRGSAWCCAAAGAGASWCWVWCGLRWYAATEPAGGLLHTRWRSGTSYQVDSINGTTQALRVQRSAVPLLSSVPVYAEIGNGSGVCV